MDRTQRVVRMIHEIQLQGKTTSPTDTPEEAALRARLVAEIREIADKRGIVDVPTEIPG